MLGLKKSKTEMRIIP